MKKISKQFDFSKKKSQLDQDQGVMILRNLEA